MSDDDASAAAVLDTALTEIADHASSSAREFVTALKTSLTTAIDQKYTSEALANDLAGFWARGVRDVARGWSDLAKLTTAIGALKPSPTPPPTGPPPPAGSTNPPPPSGSTPAEPPA